MHKKLEGKTHKKMSGYRSRLNSTKKHEVMNFRVCPLHYKLNFTLRLGNKMLSYRGETALQGVL